MMEKGGGCPLYDDKEEEKERRAPAHGRSALSSWF
jgi:hypothetical protein